MWPENKQTKKALWPIVQAFLAPGTTLHTERLANPVQAHRATKFRLFIRMLLQEEVLTTELSILSLLTDDVDLDVSMLLEELMCQQNLQRVGVLDGIYRLESHHVRELPHSPLQLLNTFKAILDLPHM